MRGVKGVPGQPPFGRLPRMNIKVGEITVTIEGSEIVRFISSDGKVDLKVKYKRTPLVTDIWYQARLIEELLKRGSLRLLLPEGIEVAFNRSNGSWRVRSEGAVRYEMEMTLEEALLFLLALTYMIEGVEDVQIEAPSPQDLSSAIDIFTPRRIDESVLTPIIERKLDKAVVREGRDLWVIERRGQRFLLRLKKPGGRFSRAIWALADMTGLEPVFELSSREALNAIMVGGGFEYLLDENPSMIELRRLLVHEIFKHRLKGARLVDRPKAIVIRSHGRDWIVDLSVGDLEVGGKSICIMSPDSYRGTLITPYGPVDLDESTADVLAAVLTALEPWGISDPDLAKQVLEALIRKYGFDVGLDRLPLAPGFLRAWLKFERFLELLPRPLRKRIKRLGVLLTHRD